MIQTEIVDKIVNAVFDVGSVSPRRGAVDRILATGTANLLTPAALRLSPKGLVPPTVEHGIPGTGFLRPNVAMPCRGGR